MTVIDYATLKAQALLRTRLARAGAPMMVSAIIAMITIATLQSEAMCSRSFMISALFYYFGKMRGTGSCLSSGGTGVMSVRGCGSGCGNWTERAPG
jgi:hypothetical protein